MQLTSTLMSCFEGWVHFYAFEGWVHFYTFGGWVFKNDGGRNPL